MKRHLLFLFTILATVSFYASLLTPLASAVDCSTVTLRFRDTNATKYGCVSVLQTYLKNNGFYNLAVDGSFETGTANAVLNFQRSQKLTDDAIAGPITWSRLKAPLTLSYPIPAACKEAGTRICVSKAQRKLRMYKSGVLVKQINVRVGGWTTDKYGNYRVHHTVPGTYSVYNKDPNPSSVRYGENAMPWSVMFDPNMYVHYSDDFRIYGYARASHGCVNVGNYTDAEWIYNNTPLNSKVIVY